MKSLPLTLVVGVWTAIASCGGGSGGRTGGTGGHQASGGTVGGGGTGFAGSSAVGGAATGGSGASKGGTGGEKADGGATVGSCPAFTPCGGDILGTWQLKSQCATGSTGSAYCVLAVVSQDKSGLKASYTFRTDGTLTYSSSGTFSESIQYSAACLGGDAGAEQTCSTFQELILQSARSATDAGQPAVTLDTFECSADSNQACNCNVSYTFAPVTQNGIYTIADNRVTFKDPAVSDGGLADAGDSVEYCVSGNTLSFKFAGSSGGTILVLAK